jgi:hypothetical protein
MPRGPLLVVLPLAGWLIVACATGSGSPSDGPGGAKYPPRRVGCRLSVFHGEKPEVAYWDDLGIANVICHIDDGEATCMGRLRAEACRMGGDIMYDLPRKPLRPKDEAMVFRARIAHTRPAPVREKVAVPDEPPPASAEESAGPVVPLTGSGVPLPLMAPAPAGSAGPAPATVAVPVDAGATSDAGP